MEAGSGDASVDLTETQLVQSVIDQTKRLMTAIGAQKLAQPLGSHVEAAVGGFYEASHK